MSLGPLNLHTKDVDTSFPSLAESSTGYACVIGDIKVDESTKTPGLFMLVVPLTLDENALDSKGNSLVPGYKFTTRLTLPSEGGKGEHDDMRLRQVCSFIDAAFGTSQGTRPDLTDDLLRDFSGKYVIVTMKRSKDTSFGDTEVKSFKPIAE